MAVISMKQLLEAGADVNREAKDGKTSLSLAVERGYGLVVQQLLQAGALFDTKDRDDWTPLLRAVYRGDEGNGHDGQHREVEGPQQTLAARRESLPPA